MDKQEGLKRIEQFVKKTINLEKDPSFNLRKEYQGERYVVFESRDIFFTKFEWMIFVNTPLEAQLILEWNPSICQIVFDIQDNRIIESRSRWNSWSYISPKKEK